MIEVIENFLPKTQFKPLQEWFMNHCEWTYVPYVVGEGEDHPDDYQFSHMFWFPNRGVVSPYMDKISPLLFKINPQVWIRVKANMRMKTDEVRVGGYHIDVGPFGHTTSIYYINSNDGRTTFENGEEFQSVENTLITFPSRLKHAGSTPSSTKTRIVLNLNYHTIN
jgi:hypothetical protein|tara:strand:- start:359 stop:856 length:498 start_codon:yes stop_codon:yes gene_type:complete